ncbi:hypothetical protein [Geothrix limicola]|uniref:hypothetical protein n=1 Tax=Geothrix limicola TaxID=2927978 RepID=UPI002555388D|nr:hypothetical protein [Geothrix limicola]
MTHDFAQQSQRYLAITLFLFSMAACQQPAATQPPKVSATLVQPSLIRAPELPSISAQTEFVSKTLIEIIVNPDGKVEGIKLISGSASVIKQVTEWLNSLEFKPGELLLSNESVGRKVHCRVLIEINSSSESAKFSIRYAGPNGRW